MSKFELKTRTREKGIIFWKEWGKLPCGFDIALANLSTNIL